MAERLDRQTDRQAPEQQACADNRCCVRGKVLMGHCLHTPAVLVHTLLGDAP